MKVRLTPRLGLWLLVAARTLPAQETYTWQELRDKFVAANPSLQAARIGIDESRAQEISAYLRPNPDFTQSTDGTQLLPYRGVYQPFTGTQFVSSISYLHERDRKRELRQESAQKATAVTASQYADQQRTLLFTLRGAFVQALQQKAILAVARESLAYYNRLVDVSSDRLKAGDISRSRVQAPGATARAV